MFYLQIKICLRQKCESLDAWGLGGFQILMEIPIQIVTCDMSRFVTPP